MYYDNYEFELTMKNGTKLVTTINALNDIQAENKLKEIYGEELVNAELI